MAAQSSRVALLFYLVFYSAFDSVIGLSNGLVAHYGRGLTAAEQAVLPGVSDALSGGGLDRPVPFAISLIASASWLVAVTAAAAALHRAGAPPSATIPLGLAGVIGAVDHALPFGTIGWCCSSPPSTCSADHGRRAGKPASTRSRVSADDVRAAIPSGSFTVKDLHERTGTPAAVVRRVISVEVARGATARGRRRLR